MPFRLILILQALFLGSLVHADNPPDYRDIHKIDVHAHIFEEMPALVSMLRSNNASVVNICNRGLDGTIESMHRVAGEMFKAHPDLFPFASCWDLRRVEEPGYSEEIVAWLDQTFKNGAVMTKIWKEVGMELRRKDGSFVMPDDPIFDPAYDLLARRHKPLMAHLADPIEAWLPLNKDSPHYGYFSSNPQFHLYGRPEYPSHAAIMAARDHILQKHPDLIVIGCHLGSFEHDLDALAERFEKYTNFNVDCAGRLRDLARQPHEKVRAFFIKYQDRLLYGVDMTWKPFLQKTPPTDAQRANFVRNLERQYVADYAFYSGKGSIQYGGKTVEALDLPPEVLEKFYHRNVERLILH